MAVSALQFTQMMIALLPNGAAWPDTEQSNWGELFAPFAENFARISAMHDVILKEMSVHTTEFMLPDYEFDFGLPDCDLEPQTFVQRRSALIIKEDLEGRQDQQFFIDLAAQLGYSITITEYDAANPGPPTAINGQPLVGDDWNYVWQITADTALVPRVYGSKYGEPYVNTNSELLECTLREYVHSHRILLFNFL